MHLIQRRRCPISALITGSKGFIGSNIKKFLRNLDNTFIELISIKDLIRLGYTQESARLQQSLILQDIFDSTKIDSVFHCATIFPNSINNELFVTDPDINYVNVELPARILDLAIKSQTKSFTNFGTIWQHVDSKSRNPASYYAETKQIFEDYLLDYQNLIDVFNITLYDTYGPFDSRPKLVPLLFKKLDEINPTIRLGSGNQLMNLTFIDDLIDVISIIHEMNATGSWTIRNSNFIKVIDLVKHFINIFQIQLDVQLDALPDRQIEMYDPWLWGKEPDFWRPKYDLELGFTEIAKYRS